MVNYVEKIKAAGGETYQIRDPEAARKNEVVHTEDLFNLIYPVGSIYLSVNTVDPSSIFGGTWERLKDRFLLGGGDTYMVGNTGGEATHTLTLDEMPLHSHGFLDYWGTTYDANLAQTKRNCVSVNGDGTGLDAGAAANSRTKTADTGGGRAHNNMPPYLVVNMWKRTA